MGGGRAVSLENLLKIHQLQLHTATAQEVQRLLAAASRNLADSAVQSISDETRFDAAYKAIMQCALVALMATTRRWLSQHRPDLFTENPRTPPPSSRSSGTTATCCATTA